MRNWWPWRRRADSTESLEHLDIVLYTRAGCHLCERAAQLMVNRRNRWNYQFHVRFVDDDPVWQARFGECVPVVCVNEKVRFRGRIEPELLDRLLEGESKQPGVNHSVAGGG